MRSRKLKRLLNRKLLLLVNCLLNVKINEVGLSKIDFFKFLCYNIYRKMKEIKSNFSNVKSSQVYQKIIDNQP